MPEIERAIHLLGLRNNTCIKLYIENKNLFDVPVTNVYRIIKQDNKLYYSYEYVFKSQKVSIYEKITSIYSLINDEKIESILIPNQSLILTLNTNFTFMIKPTFCRKEIFYGEINS